MFRLFPLPIWSFIKAIRLNGGLAPGRIGMALLWVLKLVIMEPLRWIELLLYKRKVRRHIIDKDPVFILGFYRSGTSYLHQLLIQDDRSGYMTYYQMIFPEVMLTTQNILRPILNFFLRLFKVYDPVHRVPWSLSYPGEEEAAMTTSPTPRGTYWGYLFPEKMMSYFRKYVLFENTSSSEVDDWKRAFHDLVKKISLANHGKQLVLKSPPNTARIQHLCSIFPEAKFIFIHRNPYDVYASNKKLWEVIQSNFSIGERVGSEVNQLILDTYAATIDRYLIDKKHVPERQLIEISYDELIENPVNCLREIYMALDLEDFAHCESAVQSFVEGQKHYSRLTHQLPDPEKRAVSEQLKMVFQQWHYTD